MTELERLRKQFAPEVERVELENRGLTVCAVVLDWETEGQGETAYDFCFLWETAEHYALTEGRRVIAVADDDLTREEIQAKCDFARDLYIDCFGLPEAVEA